MGVPAPPSAAGRSAGQGRPLRFAAAKGSSSNPQRHQHRSAPAPFVSPLPAFPPPHQPHLTYQPFPSPIAAIPGTRRSPSLLSSSVPKRFSQPRSQDPVSSTSLHLSPIPSPFQRGSASFNPPPTSQNPRDREGPRLPIPSSTTDLNGRSSALGAAPCQHHLQDASHPPCSSRLGSVGLWAIPNSTYGKLDPCHIFFLQDFSAPIHPGAEHPGFLLLWVALSASKPPVLAFPFRK